MFYFFNKSLSSCTKEKVEHFCIFIFHFSNNHFSIKEVKKPKTIKRAAVKVKGKIKIVSFDQTF